MVKQLRALRQWPLRRQLELLVATLVIGCALLTLFIGQPRQATLTYEDGALIYTGQVENNRMTGHGKLTYENGDVYEGQFISGVFDGQGTFTSSQGWVYTGQFKNGQPHGQGQLTTADHRVYEGQFQQGIYQK